MSAPSRSSISTGIREFVGRVLFKADSFGIHYSQSGEDIMVSSVLVGTVGISNGFYIDIGSYHPTIGSNTFLLYRNGWNGINIDPRPGSKKLFDDKRGRDINLEIGISDQPGTLQYYFISESSALNSFSKNTIEENGALDQITRVIDCPVRTIGDVIAEYLPAGKEIDFMNVDTEGFEEKVLATLDWINTRPKIIAIEQNRVSSLQDVVNSPVNTLMESKNYLAVMKNMITRTVATVVYVDKRFLKS